MESTPEEMELIQRGAKHEDKDLEEVGENVKVKHNIVDEYWYRRHSEARRWVWILTISNLLY